MKVSKKRFVLCCGIRDIKIISARPKGRYRKKLGLLLKILDTEVK